MDGNELFEWLSQLPLKDLLESEVRVEINGKSEPLITAKYYEASGKRIIYFIHK